MKALMNNQHTITASQAYKSTFVADPCQPLSTTFPCPIEVTYNQEQQAQLAYFLRLLKQASEENRWIMFIGQDALLDKRLLINAGININRVLVLKHTKNQSKHVLMTKALDMGNCSAVIVAGDIDEFNTSMIRTAAENGKSLAFVLNQTATSNLTFH